MGTSAKGDIFRVEAGVGKSTSVARYNPNTKSLDLLPKSTSGEQLILSKKDYLFTGISKNNGLVTRESFMTYRDVKGLGLTRSLPTQASSNTLISPTNIKPSSSGSLFSGGTSSSGVGGLKSLKLLGGASSGKITPVTSLSSQTTQSVSNIFATTPTSSTTQIFTTPKISSGSKTRELSLLQPQEQTLKPLTRVRTENRVFTNSLFSGSAVGTASGIGSARGSASRQAPLQLITPKPQASRQAAPTLAPTPTTTNTFKPLPTMTGFGVYAPPMFLGRVSVGGGGFNRRTRGSIFGKTRYSASLGSVLTGYSKKGDARSLSKKTFLGIGLRPQLENTSKKTKKKKKK